MASVLLSMLGKLIIGQQERNNLFKGTSRLLLVVLIGSFLYACEVKVSTSGESGGKNVENTTQQSPNPKPETTAKESDRDAENIYNRGLEKGRSGDTQGAIAEFNQAIRISPDYAPAYSSRATLKGLAGDPQGAIADFSEAIRIQPDNAIPYYNRGVVKNKLGDWNGAIADLSEAIRLKSGSSGVPESGVYVARGEAKYRLADYQGAIADFSEAVRVDPENAYAYNARGSSKLTSKDIQGAKMDFQKAAELFKQQGNIEFYNYTIEEIKKLSQ